MTTKTKKAGKNTTGTPKKSAEAVVITMVVDESGSMAHLAGATMDGFNAYVDALKKEMGDLATYFSAMTFNTMGVKKLQVGAKIAAAIHLSTENYRPDHGTPLLDAVGKAITATDEVMKQQAGTKAIIVIQTDGEENSSVEYDLHNLKLMIEARQAKGWQFVFIGAGINAFMDATKMGIATANTMSYQPTGQHTGAIFASTAANTRAYGSGASGSMNYSHLQSAAAGEDPSITLAKMKPQPKPQPAGPAPTSLSDLNLTS